MLSDKDKEVMSRYIPTIRHYANKFYINQNYISLEELLSAGMDGVVKTVGEYSPLSINFDIKVKANIRDSIINIMKKTSEFKATDLRNVKLFCDNLYQAHLDRANNSEYSSEDDLGASIDFNELINISSSSQEKCIFAYNVYLYELIFNNYCYSFNETFNKFNVSLVKLSYIEQLIIALYYKDELTYNQISSILNISSETIFKVHSLAISKLRHCEQE